MYVDESSQGDYVVTSWFVPSNMVVETRKTLKGLLLPNQRSLHMQTENRVRRERLLKVILDFEPDIRIFVASPHDHGGHSSARASCLIELAQVACRNQVQRLVLGRNDATERRDRRAIAEGARKRKTRGRRSNTPTLIARMSRCFGCPMPWAGRGPVVVNGGRRFPQSLESTTCKMREARVPRPSGRVSGSLPGFE